ncbi:MAG: hypothetical protein PHI97_04000 [Desulfobulbus sp.]|nr:hypothetical protein [Desulfobulbus sp.]
MATQIEEESEQKSLGFKTLLRKTLRAYLQINQKIHEMIVSGGEWKIGELKESLDRFFVLYQELVGGEKVPGEVMLKKLPSPRHGEEIWSAKTDEFDIAVTKTDLIKIYEIFESQRLLLLKAYEVEYKDEYKDKDFILEDTHFHLHGEERTVTSMLSIKADRLKAGEMFDFNYTWTGPLIFKRNAIEAIRKGSCDNNIGHGLSLKSKQKIYYIVTPVASHTSEINFAEKILNMSNCLEKPLINGKEHQVPSIINNNFSTISELIQSLVIEYFVEYGDFTRLAICNQCDSLYIESQENYTKYCSRKCTKAHYEDSIIKEKSNCRERQRNWYDRHCVGVDKISIRSNECDSCELTHKRNGGDCNVLWEKYRENVLEWFEVEKGESAYSYMCRQRQLNFYSEQLGRSKTTMGNSSTCKNCADCFTKEGGEIISPGECKKILEKPKRKSKVRIGMGSVVLHTKNLGTDFNE